MALKKQHSKRLFIFLLVFGLFLFISGEGYLYYAKRVLSFTTNPFTNLPVRKESSYPAKIIINSIGINLNIQEGSIADGVWVISQTTATHLINSSVPEETGNTVIYGHNTKPIFARLFNIKINDQIEIQTKDAKSYLYKVTKTQWVKPTDVNVIAPTDYSVLTIYTCAGFLDQYRLVVKAVPIS